MSRMVQTCLSFFQGPSHTALPPYLYIGNDSRHPGAGFFAKKHGPLMVNNPEAALKNVRMQKGVTDERFAMRRKLAGALDTEFQEKWDTRGVKAYADMYDDAVRLMKSEDLVAFDLTKEPEELRKSYGKDTFGQGCLLARRLVEHGVRFIEISFGSWDTHTANFINTPRLCDTLDTALTALVTDLEQRGMLESTMIVVSSEFGAPRRSIRTKVANTTPSSALSSSVAASKAASTREPPRLTALASRRTKSARRTSTPPSAMPLVSRSIR